MRLYRWVAMSLRELVHGSAVAAEMDEEMRFHLAMQAERNLRSGLSPEDARRKALLEFGGVVRHQQVMREERPTQRVEQIMRDVRFALRLLVKTPGFTIAAVLTLAVGIGANTAVFSAVNGVLLHPLPYPNADRLVTIAHTTKGDGLPKHLSGSTATSVVYSAAKSFTASAIYEAGKVTLSGNDLPERIPIAHVSQSIFAVLGIVPIVGRAFSREEDQPGAQDVVLISQPLWRRRFGSDPHVLGRTILLDGRPTVVIGVMPREFAFPSEETELWMPMKLDMNDLGGFHTPEIARLRAGVTPDAAERELVALFPRVSTVVDFLSPETLRSSGLRPDVHPYANDVVPSSVRHALWTLWATVTLVLLIACVNVASLLAVRGESRRREMLLRSALGAERRILRAQSITECAVLVLLGGTLGLVLANAVLHLLRRFGADAVPRLSEARIDGTVLLVTSMIAAAVALIFGLVPLGRQSAGSDSGVLRLDGRGGTTDAHGMRVRNALVIAQVAMAAMLLVMCGLMMRTARNLTLVDIGFQPARVLTFRVALPNASYPTAQDVMRFHTELLNRIRALPGVVAAGATSDLPLTGTGSTGDILRTDRDTGTATALHLVAEMRAATPGYFEAMGIPLRRGRLLRDDDSQQPSGAVLVTDAVARLGLAGRDPLTSQVAHGLAGVRGERPLSVIVGVVGDVRGVSLEEPPIGAVYYPMVNKPGVNMDWLARYMSYAVRVRSDPTALLPSIHALVHDLDPAMPISEARTLSSIVEAASSSTRFAMVGLTLAASAGLALGSIGLYGMLAFATAQRTREIGVRIALGAKPSAMRGSVLRQGLVLCGSGLLLGLLAAIGLRVAIRPLLYDVSSTDPLTFTAVAAVLIIVGTIAAWIPASRAARLDPVRALRLE